jgi:hypothetical protein
VAAARLRRAAPELPDAGGLTEAYDLQAFLAATAAAIGERAGWAVKTDVVLALFSFQKFVMYKDLEANAGALASHRLVRQLVTRQGSAGDQVIGLPDEIRRMDLDAEYPPERTFQVVDADSSQLRAIAAAARAHDLVIEGPPGTGKSQTITNLIAQALAPGKSVLFVAEKMAALSVVHARLVAAGLGEFCLELHSTKANKRAVMQALGAALDASLQGVAAPTASTERLPKVRAALTDYVRALHEPFGALGATPYQGYGEYGRVRQAPRVAELGFIDGITREQFEQTVRDLGDLAAAAEPIGVPGRASVARRDARLLHERRPGVGRRARAGARAPRGDGGRPRAGGGAGHEPAAGPHPRRRRDGGRGGRRAAPLAGRSAGGAGERGVERAAARRDAPRRAGTRAGRAARAPAGAARSRGARARPRGRRRARRAARRRGSSASSPSSTAGGARSGSGGPAGAARPSPARWWSRRT